jgi:hypothetical protein
MQQDAAQQHQHAPRAARVAVGFMAGFIATLIFHQPALAVLHAVGMTPATPYVLKPVPPLGVPQVISLAFWGGVWGIILALIAAYWGPVLFWPGAILFGAIFPTLVAWFVVFPLKGIPVAGGFHFPGILVGPIVNGMWGLGSALFLFWLPRAAGAPQIAPDRGRRSAF